MNLFLVGKNVLIVMVPILINKDVFEPSYNDLKFTVQNLNCFCTNLIFCMISRMWGICSSQIHGDRKQNGVLGTRVRGKQ